MTNINHKEKLLEIYKKSFDISDIKNISKEDKQYLENIILNIDKNKGVYTVLITLLVHKLIDSKQDIRFFQNKVKKGFSFNAFNANSENITNKTNQSINNIYLNLLVYFWLVGWLVIDRSWLNHKLICLLNLNSLIVRLSYQQHLFNYHMKQ